MIDSGEGPSRRGARRAAEQGSPWQPAPDGWPQEPGALWRARFRTYGEGRSLSVSDVAAAPAEQCRVHPVSAALAGLAGDRLLIATIIVALTFSSVQWATPNIIGIDGYFHIKFAQLIREQGWRMLLPIEFPWLQLTILNPAEYTNHHLLFHLLLTPFTLGDLRIGAKLAPVVFASGALLVAYQLMVEHRVRYPLLWLVVMLASSGPFLYRLSQTRRQSLTLLLLLLALYLAFKGRGRWLVPLGFAFIWLFDGFPLLLGVCGAAFLGDWWGRRRPNWGLVLYPALGVLLGTVVNPYFPNNVQFSYLHMLPKVLQLVGIDHADTPIQVGNEWYPYSRDFLWRANWLAILLVPAGLLPLALDARPSRLRAVDGKVIALGIVALTFLVLFLRSRRWIEAEPVFATLFCAFAWSRAMPDRITDLFRSHVSQMRRQRLALAGVALATVAVLVQLNASVTAAMNDTRSTRDYTRYRAGAQWLAANTPDGARVFATDWDDFPELFFWNTHNTYLIGLDPTYMYLYDGPLYLQWRAITRGQVERPGALIRDVYGAGWVFTDHAHRDFLRQAAEDPELVEVFRDNQVILFAVRGWQPAP
ncbi:MAG: hypothetical protein M3O34_07140 [Chloroflexota bacterium]|nr:hypothetical protein [Chloroflexota bacterium]